MSSEMIKIPAEAEKAFAVVRDCLGSALLGFYLHGSAVAGGLRPNSDVDVLAVINRPLREVERQVLTSGLLEVSGHYPAPEGAPRPLELVVMQQADLSLLSYPAKCELVYGEWLRDEFEAGGVAQTVSDPEYTLLLAQAHQQAVVLYGAPLADFMTDVSLDDIRQAIADALAVLILDVQGDERNVLLTLARMWRTVVDGDFLPKNSAADWAIPRLPEEAASLLEHARQDYLSNSGFDWQQQQQAVQRTIVLLKKHIEDNLPQNL